MISLYPVTKEHCFFSKRDFTVYSRHATNSNDNSLIVGRPQCSHCLSSHTGRTHFCYWDFQPTTLWFLGVPFHMHRVPSFKPNCSSIWSKTLNRQHCIKKSFNREWQNLFATVLCQQVSVGLGWLKGYYKRK